MKPKGTCAFCDEDKELCESHIIPKLMQKRGLFAPKGKSGREAYLFKSWEDKYKSVQDGVKEFLLCENCEANFSKYEDYMERLLAKGFWESTNCLHKESFKLNKRQTEFRVIGGLNYEKFKMFVLSVFWRLSVAKKYSTIDLGPHREALHEILRNKICPDEYTYQILVSRLKLKGEDTNIIMPTTRYRISPSYIAREVYMGGYSFWLFFGNGRLDASIQKFCLSAEGRIILFENEITETPMGKWIRELVISKS